MRNRSISRAKSIRDCRVRLVERPERQERLDRLAGREGPLGEVGEDDMLGPRPLGLVDRGQPDGAGRGGRHDLDLAEDRIHLG